MKRWLLALLMLLTLFVVPHAFAQTGNCASASPTASQPTQGAAYACASAYAKAVSDNTTLNGPTHPGIYCVVGPVAYTSTLNVYYAHVWRDVDVGISCNSNGGGVAYTPFYYPVAQSCAVQSYSPSGVARADAFSGTVCNAGCGFSVAVTSSYSIVGSDGISYTWLDYTGSSSSSTGSVCGGASDSSAVSPTPVTDQDCVPDGTLTQCVRSDGRICAQGSTGKQFCWNPSEYGTKVDANDAATRAPSGSTPNPPPVAPANNGNWSSQGQVSDSVTSGGSTTTNNTTVYQSTYGSQGSNTGSTNPSTGQDSNSGSGDGSGNGNDDTTTGAGLGDGDDPTRDDLTIDGIMSDFESQLQASATYQGISGFFTVTGGGSCPVFTLPASAWWPAMTMDFQCGSNFITLFQMMGYCVLAAATIVAARIALTNGSPG